MKQPSTAYKVCISLLFGLLGFLGAYLSIRFPAGEFSVDIHWSFVFPMLPALAYGPVYAVMAAVAGLGAFSPFLLWFNNGWANLLTASLYTGWWVFHGTLQELRDLERRWWSHPIAAGLVYSLLYGLITLAGFPLLMGINPPPWNPHAALSMPLAIVKGIAIKGSLIMFSMFLISITLMRVPFVRKLFRLPVAEEQEQNGKILLMALSVALFLWAAMLVFNGVFLDRSFPYTMRPFSNPYETMALIILILAGFSLAGGYMKFNENQRLLQGQLVAAQHQAEEASRAKSAFLANMSHEIRTPMNGMMGFLQLLNLTELTEEQREYLELMNYSSESLLGIINDVLDYSKIEAGQMVLHEEGFDLAEMADTAVRSFMAQAQVKGIEMKWVPKPRGGERLWGDVQKIRQILANLLSNAIKFTEMGTVSVEVSQEPISGEHCRISLTVGDTGIGISQEQLLQLTQPFYQGDLSINKKYKGTGLGLSIVKSFVDMMKGTLEVTSTEGEGTEITVNLILPLENGSVGNEKANKQEVEEQWM